MQKMNNETVKPKCVTARLVSIDRMDNDINGDIRLLLGLDFGEAICYRSVSSPLIKEWNLNAFFERKQLFYHHSGGPHDKWWNYVILGTYVGKYVWILLENQPKLYFATDSTPLVLHTPQLCGNDHLSRLVTRRANDDHAKAIAKETTGISIMAGKKIADEMQMKLDRAINNRANKNTLDSFIPDGCVRFHPFDFSHKPEQESQPTEQIDDLQHWDATVDYGDGADVLFNGQKCFAVGINNVPGSEHEPEPDDHSRLIALHGMTGPAIDEEDAAADNQSPRFIVDQRPGCIAIWSGWWRRG